MYDQITEQLQKTLKPVTDITNINVKTLETLAEKQTALFQTLLSTSTEFTKSATAQTDVNSAVEAQKAYAQNLQETILAAAQDAYGVISEAQEKSGEILQTVVADVQAQAAAATQQK